MKTLVNLTPHALKVFAADSKTLVQEIPATGVVPRCQQVNSLINEEEGIGYYATSYGEVVGLPEPEENTLLVVSFMVRQALPERKDLVSPGDLVRDEAGVILGCKGFFVNQ